MKVIELKDGAVADKARLDLFDSLEAAQTLETRLQELPALVRAAADRLGDVEDDDEAADDAPLILQNLVHQLGEMHLGASDLVSRLEAWVDSPAWHPPENPSPGGDVA